MRTELGDDEVEYVKALAEAVARGLEQTAEGLRLEPSAALALHDVVKAATGAREREVTVVTLVGLARRLAAGRHPAAHELLAMTG